MIKPIQEILSKHHGNFPGRTDDYFAAKMGVNRQHYRQLTFIFFNQPALIRVIEARLMTISRAYREAKARQNPISLNTYKETL